MSRSKAPAPAGRRRRARSFALLGVYAWLINPGASVDELLAALPELVSDGDGPLPGCDLDAGDFADSDRDFCALVLRGVTTCRARLEELISAGLDRDLARLSKVERACLMIGAWELAECPDTPPLVAINEAVELCKKFGSERGYRLVNAVLDKVAAATRPPAP